jgi:hypothetical protein
MGTGSIRVEIELAALAAPVCAVLLVLVIGFHLRRLFTVRATPPFRPLVVSPARQENNDAWPYKNRSAWKFFSCAFVSSLALAVLVETKPAPPATWSFFFGF